MMRNFINIVETLSEAVSFILAPTGMREISGSRIMADIKVWKNPLRKELETAIHECFAMDGEPNLRGIAYGNNVWVWGAENATHAGLVEGLGLWDNKSQGKFDWITPNPEFCFFMVYGSRWQENPDRPIVLSYSGNSANFSVLGKTIASKWRTKVVAGGAWMSDTTR